VAALIYEACEVEFRQRHKRGLSGKFQTEAGISRERRRKHLGEEVVVMVTHPLPLPAPVLPRHERGRAVIAVVPAGEDPFVNAMLEMPFSVQKHANPLEWVASLALHFLMIGTLLLIPLYFTDAIDVRAFSKTFLVGPPPPAPPPAAAPVEKIVRTLPKERFMKGGRLTTPVVIPREIAVLKEAPIPPDMSGMGVVGGIPGGIPGGQVGGVLGGIIGGTGTAAGPVLTPPAPVKKIVRIGGQVKPPKQLFEPDLAYPPVAKAARVQGTVTIEAIIDERGDVVQAHAVDGSPLLVAAALQAVSQWKYEPTTLNGQPVSVQMTVYVKYHLQ
jgi:protein TonB